MADQLRIRIPEIKLHEQGCWLELEAKYRSAVVIKEGRLFFTDVFWFLAHIRNRSRLAHSIVAHLAEDGVTYARYHSNEFMILKGAALDGFFGVRESMACMVNCVWELGVDCSRMGSSGDVLKEVRSRDLIIKGQLERMIPRQSTLGKYLSEFRHPHVHREDLSNISMQDLVAAFAGVEQPGMVRFIDESVRISEEMQGIEREVAASCEYKLGLRA